MLNIRIRDEQKSNLKTNFLNRIDELFMDRERGTSIPTINYMPKNSLFFDCIPRSTYMYSEQEFNKSNHNLL